MHANSGYIMSEMVLSLTVRPTVCKEEIIRLRLGQILWKRSWRLQGVKQNDDVSWQNDNWPWRCQWRVHHQVEFPAESWVRGRWSVWPRLSGHQSVSDSRYTETHKLRVNLMILAMSLPSSGTACTNQDHSRPSAGWISLLVRTKTNDTSEWVSRFLAAHQHN